MRRLLIAVLIASSVVSLTSSVRAQNNGLPSVTIMHGGVNQLDKDLAFLLKLAGPDAEAQLNVIQGIVPAFTGGIDPARPMTVDIILKDTRDYRISLPIAVLKDLLKNIEGFAGGKAVRVGVNKYSFRKGKAFNGVAIIVDTSGDGKYGAGDYMVLANDQNNIPKAFTPLTAIDRLKEYDLAASVTNTAAGADARKKAIDAIREELDSVAKPLPNETDDQFELRKLAQNHRMDELERLFVDAEELVLGWKTDYEKKEGRLELELSALADTQLAADIAAMGEDPSLFSSITRSDLASVFGRLNHNLDAMRQGNITQFLGLLEKQALARIEKSDDIEDDNRPAAAKALQSFIGMLRDGNSKLGRIDGFLEITETDEGNRTLSGGIRADCGTEIESVLAALQQAGWDVKLNVDQTDGDAGDEPTVVGDPKPESATEEEDTTEEEEAAEEETAADGCGQIGKISFHEVKIPVSPEFDFPAVFGSDTMLVAAGPNVVYYAIGANAEADIRKAIAATGEDASQEDGTFFEVWYRIGPWIQWAQQREERLGSDPDMTEEEKKAHAELQALGKRAQSSFETGLDAIYTKLQVKKKDDQKIVIGYSTVADGLLAFVGGEIARLAKENLQ